ncbi:MAG: hypothetical protein V3W32_09610 [Gemmatimonadota bacterium]
MLLPILDQLVGAALPIVGPGRGAQLGAALDPQAVPDDQVRGVRTLRHQRRRQHQLGVQSERHDLAVLEHARHDTGDQPGPFRRVHVPTALR